VANGEGTADRRRLAASARWAVLVFAALAFAALQYTPDVTDPYLRTLMAEENPEASTQIIERMAEGSEGGTRQRQVLLVCLGLAGALGVLRRGGARLCPVRPLAAVLLVYVAVLVSSVLWSVQPPLSIRRVIAYIFALAAIAGVVRQFEPEEVVDLAFLSTATALVAGVAVELRARTFAPLDPSYRFFGLFHPNIMGQNCALLIFAAVAIGRGRKLAWLRFPATAAGALGLVLTRSRAAAAGAVIALAVRWLATARPSRLAIALVVLAWGGCLGVLVAGDRLSARLENTVLMGRAAADAGTLSGRTELWSELLRHVADRPILGHGMGAFWDAERIEQVSTSQGWAVSHAHSTYLDQWLDLGLVGLVTFVLMAAGAAAMALRRFRRAPGGGIGFVSCVLVFALLVGTMESVVTPQGLLAFLLFWAIAFVALRAADEDGVGDASARPGA
jgi:exopolysaccharide production protein ExoQ